MKSFGSRIRMLKTGPVTSSGSQTYGQLLGAKAGRTVAVTCSGRLGDNNWSSRMQAGKSLQVCTDATYFFRRWFDATRQVPPLLTSSSNTHLH
ncbi:hypothetical protein VTK56DRAFT_5096 [Thermocarpiscus australiensis]